LEGVAYFLAGDHRDCGAEVGMACWVETGEICGVVGPTQGFSARTG
jgi:hypothetical protein